MPGARLETSHPQCHMGIANSSFKRLNVLYCDQETNALVLFKQAIIVLGISSLGVDVSCCRCHFLVGTITDLSSLELKLVCVWAPRSLCRTAFKSPVCVENEPCSLQQYCQRPLSIYPDAMVWLRVVFSTARLLYVTSSHASLRPAPSHRLVAAKLRPQTRWIMQLTSRASCSPLKSNISDKTWKYALRSPCWPSCRDPLAKEHPVFRAIGFTHSFMTCTYVW